MRIRRVFLSLLFALLVAGTSFADVLISVSFAPPALPVYAQPLCPGDGYIWTPGYWAWDPDNGYYWVPGTWVLVPEVGFLWTPGYWAWADGLFYWHPGYWGPVVGFYGGINYGFGYFGSGFEGGYWRDRQFFYNRAVNNVNVTNVYNTTVVNNNSSVTRVSYNGGPGGVSARPTAQQQAAAQQPRVNMTPAQTQHEQTARGDRQLLAAVNHGKPEIAATPRPAALHGNGVVPATAGARYNPPPGTAGNPASQPNATPRPGSNAPPAGNRAPARNDVPRPPSASRPENTSPTHSETPHNAQPAEPPHPSKNTQPAPKPQPEQPARPQPEARPKPEPQKQPEPQRQEASPPRPKQQEPPQAEPRKGGTPPQEQHGDKRSEPPRKDGESPENRPPQ